MAALDPAGWLADATADPVWPPLHAAVLGVVLGLGGPDHRLAILPSLAGWGATILMAWLIADRAAGWFAGAVAAALALASPAFRLLGSDVMLEGLGSALGAMTLYAFMRCDGSAAGQRWVRPLAILLTLLFLEKFNYWLLILAALALAAAPGRAGPVLAAAAPLLRRLLVSAPGLLGVTALIGAAALAVSGPVPVTALGRGFLVYPDLVLTAGYGALLLQACRIWRRERWALSPAALELARWHALPVLLWLLVPHALVRFLWFIGPTHRGASAGYDPWQALQSQWAGFAEGFHSPALALPVLGLAVLGGARLARAPGARCVPIFAALAAAVLVLHPQQQWRFQATALFAVWVCAGVGAGLLAGGRARMLRPLLAASLVLLAWQPPAPLADRVAIRTPEAPSDLALAAAYLPLLDGARGVGAAATFGRSDLFAWTLREACRCRVPVDQPSIPAGASRDEAAASTASWLDRAPASHVLLVDAPPRRDDLAGVIDALRRQDRLTPGPAVPAGDAVLQAWRAAGPPPHPAPRRWRLDAALSAGLAALAVTVLLWPAQRRRLAAKPGADHHSGPRAGKQE